MQPKQNPTNPEALLLIRMKRDRAKAAMDQIVKRFGIISNTPEPGLEVLLDYLTNMVYALELLLKVMANDWRTHRVGAMYQEIFGRTHSCPPLMTVLERAIYNQKFIYEPADGLINHIPDMEALWDELTTEFYSRHWMEDSSVIREVLAPPEFIQFLRDNLPRFYQAEVYHSKPQISREHRIQMLQYQIQALQRELEQVQDGEESLDESSPQLFERLQQEYLDRLQGAAGCFEFNTQIRNGTFSFGTWRCGKILPGCLG